jgi:hypothetical protein
MARFAGAWRRLAVRSVLCRAISHTVALQLKTVKRLSAQVLTYARTYVWRLRGELVDLNNRAPAWTSKDPLLKAQPSESSRVS